jgi:glutamate carboxypeptidase
VRTARRVLGAALAAALVAAPARALSTDSPSYDLLRRLVDINTATDNAAGLDAARAALVPEFEKLGFAARTIELGGGHRLLAFDAPQSKPKLLLTGHLDTVFKKDSAFQALRADGGSLRGPGVIDMKGGLVLMRDVLAGLDPETRRGVRVLVNDDEETGSALSKGRMAELSDGIRDVLVFEPGLPDGALVVSESGVRWLKLSVAGRAAHAGLEPEKGINACVELSSKIVRLAALTDMSRNLTVNAGVIEGGTRPNVVCEQASTTVDVRYREEADLDSTLAKLESIRAKMSVHNALLGLDPSAKLEELARVPSMSAAASRELYAAASRAAAAVGVKVAGRHVGYASDGNHLAAAGHRVLVGLGPYGGGLHAESEFMAARSFEDRLKLDTELIRSLLK